MEKTKRSLPDFGWLIFVLGSGLVWYLGCNQQIFDLMHDSLAGKVMLLIYAALCAILFLAAFRINKSRKNAALACMLILILAFILRGLLVLAMPYNNSMHDLKHFIDLGSMDYADGHLGYIEYLIKNHHLPDFDPRTRWCFYNPPGFHLLAAIILEITYKAGVPQPLCYESIQIVNLLASSLTVWLIYKILREFDIDEKTLFWATSIVAFFPFFFIFAGVPNNDMLSVFCMTLAVFYTIRWFKNPVFGNIMMIALAVGYGMFTKLNSAIIAFGIGFIFLFMLIKNRNQFKWYIAQFIPFILLCAPLGLGVPIRNLLKFDMPLLYIQQLSPSEPQYISGFSLMERLGIPWNKDFLYPFFKLDPKLEHNVWIMLVRTALFDEYSIGGSKVPLFALILLILGCIVFILATLTFIWFMFFGKKVALPLRIMALITFVVTIYSYISFCLKEAYVCTMSFRYVAILTVFWALAAAVHLTLCREEKDLNILKKASFYISQTLGYIFMLFCLVFMMIFVYVQMCTI